MPGQWACATWHSPLRRDDRMCRAGNQVNKFIVTIPAICIILVLEAGTVVQSATFLWSTVHYRTLGYCTEVTVFRASTRIIVLFSLSRARLQPLYDSVCLCGYANCTIAPISGSRPLTGVGVVSGVYIRGRVCHPAFFSCSYQLASSLGTFPEFLSALRSSVTPLRAVAASVPPQKS